MPSYLYYLRQGGVALLTLFLISNPLLLAHAEEDSSPIPTEATTTTEIGEPEAEIVNDTEVGAEEAATPEEEAEATETSEEEIDTSSTSSVDSLEKCGSSNTTIHDTSAPPSEKGDSLEVVTNTPECTLPQESEDPSTENDALSDGTSTEEATSSNKEVFIASSTAEGLTGAPTTTPPIVATSTDPEASTTITTGKSAALANVLNVANTNLVNANGSIVFLNLTDGATTTVDLRPSTTTEATGTCSLSACGGTSGTIDLDNDTHITNLIDLDATSGGNTIDGAHDAKIQSGDAFAALNLVNIANTNIVDSNYFLVAMNSFGNVNGDIIFPNVEEFFTTTNTSPSSMNLTQDASVTNDLALTATSGNNMTDNTGSTTIQSGEAHTTSSIFNQLSTTLTGDKSIDILFRVHGNWNGELVNAPSGLYTAQAEDGTYYITSASTTLQQLISPPQISQEDLDSGAITSTTSALIHNAINLTALSGDNVIKNADSALITSGNAFAGANLINIANANVVGRNWLLGIVNIFGDFNGNLVFDRENKLPTPPLVGTSSLPVERASTSTLSKNEILIH